MDEQQRIRDVKKEFEKRLSRKEKVKAWLQEKKDFRVIKGIDATYQLYHTEKLWEGFNQ